MRSRPTGLTDILGSLRQPPNLESFLAVFGMPRESQSIGVSDFVSLLPPQWRWQD